MSRACMKDRFEECFEDCPNCPRADHSEPDPDEEYERYREERTEALREGLYDI